MTQSSIYAMTKGCCPKGNAKVILFQNSSKFIKIAKFLVVYTAKPTAVTGEKNTKALLVPVVGRRDSTRRTVCPA